MGWEWAAPAATAASGVGGIFFTWLAGKQGRDQANSLAARTAAIQERERTHREWHELQMARKEACVGLLAAYRRIRVFVMTRQPNVTLAPRDRDGRQVPFIGGADELQDALQLATARMQLLEGGSTPIFRAGGRMHRAFQDLAVARAEMGRGALPEEIVEALREAEREFVRVAHRELVGDY